MINKREIKQHPDALLAVLMLRKISWKLRWVTKEMVRRQLLGEERRLNAFWKTAHQGCECHKPDTALKEVHVMGAVVAGVKAMVVVVEMAAREVLRTCNSHRRHHFHTHRRQCSPLPSSPTASLSSCSLPFLLSFWSSPLSSFSSYVGADLSKSTQITDTKMDPRVGS